MAKIKTEIELDLNKYINDEFDEGFNDDFESLETIVLNMATNRICEQLKMKIDGRIKDILENLIRQRFEQYWLAIVDSNGEPYSEHSEGEAFTRMNRFISEHIKKNTEIMIKDTI